MSKKNKKEEFQEEKTICVLHIYDFLNLCKLTRSQHDSYIKKYEQQGVKTLEEWIELTKLKPFS